jgi:beta-galactosidase
MAVAGTPGRIETELDGSGWRLWLDHGAYWWNDDVYLPPVTISGLPLNPPTCGWEEFASVPGKIVDVPATVEEHYWGEIGGVVPLNGGDYTGVSWWSRTFDLDPGLEGKRITLHFEQVNLRAEVFVNRKLVGYDVIGNTPFECDITDAVRFGGGGGKNTLDVRITDPVGNFTWNDNVLMRWGENLVPAVNGFGGITGGITLRATDAVHVDDIYVQNQPDPKKVNVFAAVGNSSGETVSGKATLTIHEWKNPAGVVWQKTVNAAIPAGGTVLTFKVNAPKAELWELAGYKELKAAALYEAELTFSGDDGDLGKIADSGSQRFGFRFFTVKETDGDKRFYLNGRRVFLLAAMGRGFWPKNGIFVTDEIADRERDLLIELGFNMMVLHRAVGQPPVIDYADRYGLMTYEEPGGYRIWENPEDNIDAYDEQADRWRWIKTKRMIIRDRSLPSMVIYNLKNEAQLPPTETEIEDMRLIHELDPSRILTYNSDRNRSVNYNEKVTDPSMFKAHMLPFDDTIYDWGWIDHHHWSSFPVNVDTHYSNPRFFWRGVVDHPRAPVLADSLNRIDPGEILFWGEEGSFGTMVSLERIKDEIAVHSASGAKGATGFRELQHLDWYDFYDNFLDKTGFRAAFPSVDSLTKSLARNVHYYHGRNLENVRISNIADGYDLNSWGATFPNNNFVDMYRFPTADPKIFSHYTQPLYVAVKLRNKVMPLGFAPTADIFIVNELDLNGRFTLDLELADPAGNVAERMSYAVTVKGGEEFGQLLAEGVELPAIDKPGYWKLQAKIMKGGIEKASGFDDIYAVELPGTSGVSEAAIFEDDGAVETFLGGHGVANDPDAGVIIFGEHDFESLTDERIGTVMEAVISGARLIILDNANRWGEVLNRFSMSKPLTYDSGYENGKMVNWRDDGRYFVAYNKYLRGLPEAQGMNWEYQCFYQPVGDGREGITSGLKLHYYGNDMIVGLIHEGKKDVLSALSSIGLGRGEVFLSSMNWLDQIASDRPQSAPAKKLLINLIEVE